MRRPLSSLVAVASMVVHWLLFLWAVIMRLHEVLGPCCQVILKLILVMKLPLRKSLKVCEHWNLLLFLMIAYLHCGLVWTSKPYTHCIVHTILHSIFDPSRMADYKISNASLILSFMECRKWRSDSWISIWAYSRRGWGMLNLELKSFIHLEMCCLFQSFT